MKMKIVNTVVDILLITVVFMITDFVMIKLFQSENLWLELGVYVVLYGIFFGAKRGIVYLWRKQKKE